MRDGNGPTVNCPITGSPEKAFRNMDAVDTATYGH
jgi:hypothetical protein